MLSVLARSVSSRAKLVLLLALVVVLAAGAYGASAFSKLSSGGFTDSSSPSTKADALLAARFHQGDANLIFLVETPAGRHKGGANAAPAGRAAGTGAASPPVARRPAAAVGLALARSLARSPGVADVESFWTAAPGQREGFVSSDGRYGLVTAHVLGRDSVAVKRAGTLAARFDRTRDGVRVLAGGLAATNDEIGKQVSHDLALAEAVAVPLTLVALVFVFGGLVAALLPLAIGLVAILCALAVLRLLTSIVPVSVYAINLTTALGLGLAIDYSLFIVGRYREELGRHGQVREAVHAAVVSAGRTVLFSSFTVGLSMAAMAVFPFYFLRSFAYAGLAVVAVAALGAVVVLPAALTLVGWWVNFWDLRPVVGRLGLRFGRSARPERPAGGHPKAAADEGGFWRRLAEAVMRWPLASGLPVLALLVLLGSPFLSVRFGLPDDRALPSSATAHQVGNVLRADFRQDSADQLTVVLPNIQPVHPGRLASYASRLSEVPGIKAVESPEGTFAAGLRSGASPATPVVGGATYFTLENNVNPYSGAGEKLVHELRAVPSPARALLTGLAARNLDALNALEGLLPIALGLVGLSSLLALYAFTRSVVVPIKALVLNTLSLSATFGAMVWVFQDGHLGWLFGGVAATGYLTATMPVLMFCIAFGLSMDYEVFLISRIKEEWDRSERTVAANTRAVAAGLQRTGPIVTAAAALVSIVFISVATSQVSFIKLFGAGMALAVLVDATLVRGVLVPAFMRLAGSANWWAPRWLPSLAVASRQRPKDVPEEETAVRGARLDVPPA
jgi:RND superfamily putative drug exporter